MAKIRMITRPVARNFYQRILEEEQQISCQRAVSLYSVCITHIHEGLISAPITTALQYIHQINFKKCIVISNAPAKPVKYCFLCRYSIMHDLQLLNTVDNTIDWNPNDLHIYPTSGAWNHVFIHAAHLHQPTPSKTFYQNIPSQ